LGNGQSSSELFELLFEFELLLLLLFELLLLLLFEFELLLLLLLLFELELEFELLFELELLLELELELLFDRDRSSSSQNQTHFPSRRVRSFFLSSLTSTTSGEPSTATAGKLFDRKSTRRSVDAFPACRGFAAEAAWAAPDMPRPRAAIIVTMRFMVVSCSRGWCGFRIGTRQHPSIN
jgi:hypothetical protein